ncbi:MAG: hypothetical protein NT002_02920 [candidate division Zixibacteria bacterium]|nr:hypothetical protein [candidate division Zixibacteria bacterium]
MGKSRFLFKAILVLLYLLFAANTTAETFDGKRQGFIIGAGIGFGITRYSSSNEISSGRGNPSTVIYDLRIGYAPSDKLQLYYVWRQCVYIPKIIERWGNLLDDIGQGTDKAAIHLIIAPIALPLIAIWSEQHIMPFGFGLRQYFKPEAPSLFADLGAGVSGCSFPYKDEIVPKPPRNMDVVLTIVGGLGWEVKSHLSLEIHCMWGHVTHAGSHYNKENRLQHTRDKYDVLSIAFTIAVCGY